MTTRILWCGDSTLVGIIRDLNNPPYDFIPTDINEVKVCTDMLNAYHGEGAVDSINAAVSSTQCIDWRYGNTERNMPNFHQLLYNHPLVDIVVIQLGINDAYNPNISVNDFRNAFAFFAEKCAAWGKKVVFATPCPINTEYNGRLWEFQYNMKLVAADHGVQVIDHYNAIAAACTPGWKNHLPIDGFHPDEEIYQFKGQSSYLALRDLVVA